MYKIDEILNLHGIQVLRLLLYIKLHKISLTKIKRKIKLNNIGTLIFIELENIMRQIINKISLLTWQKYCQIFNFFNILKILKKIIDRKNTGRLKSEWRFRFWKDLWRIYNVRKKLYNFFKIIYFKIIYF